MEFLCIQETKLERVDRFLCQSLWGNSVIEWVCRESAGTSGGMLWGSSQTPCLIFNIYSPGSLNGKRAFWAEPRALRAIHSDYTWCLAGDFNAVRFRSERKGVSNF